MEVKTKDTMPTNKLRLRLRHKYNTYMLLT